MVPDDSLIFRLAGDGDIEGIKSLFLSGAAAPNDEDVGGWTMLHVS